MTIYRYEPHYIRRKVKTFCSKCSKKLTRTISEYFTMNPYNDLTYSENVKERHKMLDKEEESLITNGTICRKCE